MLLYTPLDNFACLRVRSYLARAVDGAIGDDGLVEDALQSSWRVVGHDGFLNRRHVAYA